VGHTEEIRGRAAIRLGAFSRDFKKVETRNCEELVRKKVKGKRWLSLYTNRS